MHPSRRIPLAAQAQGLTRQGRPSSLPVTMPPPMQVVTKGWWTLRVEEKPVEELAKSDADQS